MGHHMLTAFTTIWCNYNVDDASLFLLCSLVKELMSMKKKKKKKKEEEEAVTLEPEVRHAGRRGV